MNFISVIFVTLGVLLIFGSGAVPVDPGFDGDFSTSREVAQGRIQDDPTTDPATHHSDILSMLGALKGGDELNNVDSLLKGLSIMKTAVNSLFKLSPMYSSIVEEVAKKNPALRVILKASKDQFPDLKDVYDLTVHSRKKEIGDDITHAALSNPQYLQIVKLMKVPNMTMNSAPALTKLVKLWTGVDIDLNQNVLIAVANGNIEVTEKNLAQVNMIYLLEYMYGSLAYISKLISMIPDQDPNMLQNALKILPEIDTSKLSKIKVLNSHVDNDKYKISDGKGTFLPDPDATRVVDDYAHAKKMSKEGSVDTNKGLFLSLQ